MQNNKLTLTTIVYYLSIPLFIINGWFTVLGILMLPFALGYESTPLSPLVISYVGTILISLFGLSLFVRETIKIIRNKEVSEKFIMLTFALLVLVELIVFISN